MTMPPMKVTQSPAPQAVAKARTWTSLAAAAAPDPEPPRGSASGAKRTPAARNDTAVRNRAAHPIAPRGPGSDRRTVDACLGLGWDWEWWRLDSGEDDGGDGEVARGSLKLLKCRGALELVSSDFQGRTAPLTVDISFLLF